MKNLPFIIVVLLIVGGVFFTLLTSDKQNQNLLSKNGQEQNKETKTVDKKTYSTAPETLAESDRVGKKAKFTTNLGNFTVSLFGDKAPKTVSNFITLAKDGFYNGLIFHRVIDNFMIQGGDPEGTGQGGPGYQFEDEFVSSLDFSKAGKLAMANSGPNTNGSQFFITVAPTTWLNNKHTIFGEVIEGMDVVVKISKVQKDQNDKPLTSVTIESIEIL